MRHHRDAPLLVRPLVPPSSEIRLLGPMELVGPAGPVDLTDEGRRLLGLLALRANQPVPAAELTDPDRWAGGGTDPGLAGRLAELAAAVHRAGIPAAVLARRDGYLLRVSGQLVDARRFDRLLARARGRMAAGDLAPAARLFGAALLLWRLAPDATDRPMAGIAIPPGGWAAAETTRLVQSRVAAVEDRWECQLRLAAAAYQAAGGPSVDRVVVAAGDVAAEVAAQARTELVAALRHHPLRARLWELLLTAAFLANGRRAAAEVAGRAEWTFRAQLGVEPGERLRRLARAAQRGDIAEEWVRPDAATEPAADSTGRTGSPTGPPGPVRSTAPARAPRPERAPVAGAGAPLITRDAPGRGRLQVVPPRLPVPITGLLGRETLLAVVDRWLAEPGLVTLTGPGGSGKTRLALAVAHRAPAGAAWFVDLTGVDDPTRVADGLATALGVRPEPDHPGPVEALAEAIGGFPALLVLDNCEHLAAGCAAALRVLLRRCPALRVLTTSRGALRVAGERLVPVPPLALPVPGRGYTLADLARHPATRLFLERARARSGQPVPADSADDVVRLCAELDGLPLAIELAAAWTPTLTVAEIVRRTAVDPLLLRSRDPTAPSRHRTVAAAVETSVRQLDAEARTLFEWLGVVGVSFDAETARALRGAPGARALTALVDASLVTPLDESERFRTAAPPAGDRPPPAAPLPANHPVRPARYRMLVPIRRHALSRLVAGGAEQAARRAHAGYVVTLAERAVDGLHGPGQECWLHRLRAEEPNLRAAMRWLAAADDGLGDLRLATALTRYWRLEGHYREGLDWLDAALGRHPDAPAALRARAATGAAMLAMLLCDYPAAARHAAVARTACRATDDRSGEARVELILGSVARERARYAESAAHLAAAAALFADGDDEWGEAQTAQLRGFTAWLCGDLDRAESRLRASLRRFARLGDVAAEATALMNLGAVALYRGDPDRAASMLDAALRRYATIGFPEGVGWAHNLRGLVELGARRTARAKAHLMTSLAAHRSVGDRWRIASVLEALAEVARVQQDRQRAAALLGGAARIREEIGAPVPACERPATEAVAAALQADLGAAGYASAVLHGRRASLDVLVGGGGMGRPRRLSAGAAPRSA